MSKETSIPAITRECLEAAWHAGIVRLITDPNTEGDTACAIGENWFYFGGSAAEKMGPEEYRKNVGTEDILREIFEVLEDFRNDEAFADEYAYYAAYIDECLAMHKVGEPAAVFDADKPHITLSQLTELLAPDAVADAAWRGSGRTIVRKYGKDRKVKGEARDATVSCILPRLKAATPFDDLFAPQLHVLAQEGTVTDRKVPEIRGTGRLTLSGLYSLSATDIRVVADNDGRVLERAWNPGRSAGKDIAVTGGIRASVGLSQITGPDGMRQEYATATVEAAVNADEYRRAKEKAVSK